MDSLDAFGMGGAFSSFLKMLEEVLAYIYAHTAETEDDHSYYNTVLMDFLAPISG